MNNELYIMSQYVLDAGLWKFYIMTIGFFIALVANVIQKEKGKLTILAIVSLSVLFLITLVLTIAAQINS